MYEKFANWKNFPDESTPVTAAALTHIEQGISDADITRDGTPAEVAFSSRLSAAAGSAEGLVQAERAAREAAVTAEQSARVAAIEAETAARKTAIIGESDARIAALALKANTDAVYTKVQVDAAVSPKANSVDVYTKAQSDTELSLKANKTDVYTKAETFSRTETGTQITNAITASRPPLYGTGFPNGVVAAPVGTLYSDTAVTNGASLWQKVSGAGTSGWEVVRGDTGMRNIDSLLTTTFTASPQGLYISRVNDMVVVEGQIVAAVNMVAGANYHVLTTPNGFHAAQRGWGGTAQSQDPMGYGLSTSSGGATQDVRIFGLAAIAGQTIRISAMYRSRQAWPSTLPGTN